MEKTMVNVYENGTLVYREMNAEELAQREQDAADEAERLASQKHPLLEMVNTLSDDEKKELREALQ